MRCHQFVQTTTRRQMLRAAPVGSGNLRLLRLPVSRR